MYALADIKAWEERNKIKTDGRAPCERALRDLFQDGDFTVVGDRRRVEMVRVGVAATVLGTTPSAIRIGRAPLITVVSLEAFAKARRRSGEEATAGATRVRGHTRRWGSCSVAAAAARENDCRGPGGAERCRTAEKFSGPSPGAIAGNARPCGAPSGSPETWLPQVGKNVARY